MSNNSAYLIITRDDVWETLREALRAYCVMTKQGITIDQSAAAAIELGLAHASDAHQRRLIPAGEAGR